MYGVHYFDTFTTVVSWTTVRILLVLSVIFDLDTKQVDYTCAVIHAHITEDVYVHMPRGFEEEGKVLKLQRFIYGLRQSPRNLFEHLKGYLLKMGFTQANADLCLFISDRFICLVYVDAILYAEAGALPADKSGNSTEPTFNYASVISMLQYLQGHTRPDITFAVSQCSR